MNYLKISNAGLLSVEALTLLGASSKREDNSKIGMFGSGNKYALAFLLRNNYEIKIFAGNEEIKLDTVDKPFKDKVFKCITVNGIETSITTEFGKDWQLWQAIREIYCNAIDEGSHKMEYVQQVQPSENETHFYIKTRAEISGFVGDFDTYFSGNREVVFECAYGKILSKKEPGTLNLYRKGVRCFETERDSIYDYDLTDINIDENRLVNYSWEVPSKIWNLIYQCTNEDVIKNILFNASESSNIECIGSDFANLNSNFMSKEYLEIVASLTFAPRSMSGLLSEDEIGNTTIVPMAIFKQIQAQTTNENMASKFKIYKGDTFYVEIQPDPLMQATLAQSINFFTECNYSRALDYPIIIARFTDKNVLGFADKQNQQIILSEVCMAKGVQAVIECIIEEYIHLKYAVKDETRAFQDAAITEIVCLLKTKNAFAV